MGAQSIRIKKNEEKPESKEILAEAIIRIGSALDDLRKNGINERAVIVLLHDAINAKVGKNDIKLILNTLPKLRGWYCR